MKKIWFIGYLGLALVACSCEKVLFSDPGEMQQRSEQFDTPGQITIYDIFDVELISGTQFSAEVETFEKYMENISITMDTGNLAIVDNNRLKWLPDYERPLLRLTLPPENHYLLLESPVNITTPDTLHLPSFRLVSLGKTGDFNLLLDVDQFRMATGSDNSGYFKVSGRAGFAHFWPRGSSIADGSELETVNCYVYNNSIGDCSVNVSGKLEVRMNTLGNVICYGDPEEVVVLEESGGGEILLGG